MGNGVGWRWPHHSAPKTQIIFRLEPTLGLLRSGRRAKKAQVEADLVTIHPNPGPEDRNKTAEGKAARRERRYRRRKEKAKARQVEGRKDPEKRELVIVTWNVQS